MPDFLDNVESSDDYQEPPGIVCGFDPTGNVRRINFDVYNQPVFATFYHYTPGQQNNFTTEGRERRYNANTVGIQCAGVAGVKFRSAVPGSPAIVHGERVFETDPDIAYGSISPTGIDSDGGVVPVGGKPVFFDDNTQVGSTLDVRTLGEIAFNAGTDFGVLTGNDFNVLSDNDINLQAVEDISLRTQGPGRDINALAAGDLNLFGAGNVDLSAGGTLTLNGQPYPPPSGGGGTPGEVQPEDLGALAWNFPPAALQAGGGYTLVDGYLFLSKVNLKAAIAGVPGWLTFCSSPATPTTCIASLWTISGDTVTLVEEADGSALFGDYLWRKAPFAAPRDLDAEVWVWGIYATGGTMPTIGKGSDHSGKGFGPGFSARGNTYAFLGSVLVMPSSIDLSTAPALDQNPFAGFA